MAKAGEINYLRNLKEHGRLHALNKPFSAPNCHKYFIEVGAILALLPQPPARLLDIGCGAGWTSRLFARRGYDVLGVDICPDMIEAAQTIAATEPSAQPQYRVCDYERMDLVEEFDVATFYDALHHAVDEAAALRMAHRALKPGGICVTSEPGRGHADSEHSRQAMARFNVTEKDMPPSHITALARRVGFRKCSVFPHAFDLARVTYEGDGRLIRRMPKWLGPLRKLAVALQLGLVYLRARRSGIVVLTK